jgi:ATP-dependent helicase/DNAse subunit B
MEKNNLKPQLHISNNQINIYNQCPYRYYLQYVKNLKKYEDNIFTVFGTAMHKTIQKYLQVMFNDSVKAADLLSLNNILFKQLTNLVQKE